MASRFRGTEMAPASRRLTALLLRMLEQPTRSVPATDSRPWTTTSTALIPWTAFDRFTRSDALLLLHQDKPGVVRFIPRSFCPADETWQTLLRLVSERVPEG